MSCTLIQENKKINRLINKRNIYKTNRLSKGSRDSDGKIVNALQNLHVNSR